MAQVSQVVAIEQSSRKMGQIISTIEGIAFQTNILALNAAVEAAAQASRAWLCRGGRRGAQPGAALVRGCQGDSGADQRFGLNIERGAGLMQSASQTIDQVVQSVAHVNSLMGQMGVAAREQSEGISQVNEAVTHAGPRYAKRRPGEQSAASSRVMSDRRWAARWRSRADALRTAF